MIIDHRGWTVARPIGEFAIVVILKRIRCGLVLISYSCIRRNRFIYGVRNQCDRMENGASAKYRRWIHGTGALFVGCIYEQ